MKKGIFMKVTSFWLALLFLVTISIYGATPYGVFKTKRELRQYEKKVFSKSNKHVFSFLGKIVDEKDQPLEGVKMEVSLSQSAWNGRGSKYYVESSGNIFNITTKECRSVSIKFIKAGYYPAYAGANYLDITKRKLKYDFDYDGKTIKANNIVVKMTPVGEIPKTVRSQIHEHVSLSLSNDEVKLHVIKIPGSLYNRDKEQYYSDNNLFKLIKKLPPNVIYAIPAIENNKIKEKEVGNGTYKVPASVTLCTNDKNGGLILVEKTKEKHRFRAMKKAPENGYQKRILISNVMINDNNPLFFYIKINNYYGKIKILNFYNRQDKDGVGLEGWLVINAQENNRNINSYEQ